MRAGELPAPARSALPVLQLPGALPRLRGHRPRRLLSARRTDPPPTPAGGSGRPLDGLDAAVDRWFAPLRGRPAADTAAGAVSAAADYGGVWVALAALRCAGGRAATRRAVVALALSGVGAFALNAGLKAAVRRRRPEPALRVASAVEVRAPRSTSFPSGHTLAAWCTAVTMAEGPVGLSAYLAIAAGVGASRVHLVDHHATDVLGGAAAGAALGLVLRPAVERLARRP